MEKDHHKPEYSEASYERRMRKIATKGVVQLFNAVAEHQKKLQSLTKEAEDVNTETYKKIQKKENQTKDSFFKKLKDGKVEEEPKKEANLFSYSKGGWSAFKFT